MQHLECFIHIGLPKTATSLLQEKYFPKIKEVLYVGKTLNSDHDYKINISDLSTLNISAVDEHLTSLIN
ncbi:hypothetical protein [Maridesulfovibrio hydrothermalis]|uniref:Uncharacterized protein n=1 Tax=Maridesulfovibrio hydrothermalis AM13 = DSM 14728 TaxID=1121451 RepID=L0RCB9_9BACT|nr:hypothetical protein [Maridesulfovibrio hydrothermalis]CCO23216.1 protein of unknown function [Maridesulfovibrio hydrothermalis AM13 = DSM 14728]